MGKRLIDLALASAMLLALSPLMLICALIVKLSSPGPIVYRARRVGLGGRPFTMYKFRSMVRDAHKLGSRVTAGGDPRVTKAGRMLRRFRLDELPQLIN
ncbi:sugar transferase, partial [Candidatus Poribacteria bacterium]